MIELTVNGETYQLDVDPKIRFSGSSESISSSLVPNMAAVSKTVAPVRST